MAMMRETVELAPRERSRALHKQLKATGNLPTFVEEWVQEINQAIADVTGNSPQVRKAWSPEGRHACR